MTDLAYRVLGLPRLGRKIERFSALYEALKSARTAEKFQYIILFSQFFLNRKATKVCVDKIRRQAKCMEIVHQI